MGEDSVVYVQKQPFKITTVLRARSWKKDGPRDGVIKNCLTKRETKVLLFFFFVRRFLTLIQCTFIEDFFFFLEQREMMLRERGKLPSYKVLFSSPLNLKPRFRSFIFFILISYSFFFFFPPPSPVGTSFETIFFVKRSWKMYKRCTLALIEKEY